MRLLFVKLQHIGDSLLLTPTLTAARQKYPDAQIWVVVRKGCEGIMAGCPAIDRVFTAAAPETALRSGLNWWQDGKLALELRRQNFDYAFDLSGGDRGRWLVALSGARVRCTNDYRQRLNWWWRRQFNQISTFDWMWRHRVEKDFFTVQDVLPLADTIPPLAFDRARTQPWPPAEKFRDFVVLHPASRWQRKLWQFDHWVALGRWWLERVENIVISVGPDPKEVALGRELQTALGERTLSTEGKLNWAQVAGLLYRARAMVAVDTAALHLSAACQCPSVGLFCPSMVVSWEPWQVKHRVVCDPDFAPLGPRPANEDAEAQTVGKVRLADVIRACEELS
jgi:heptosyltransferase-3